MIGQSTVLECAKQGNLVLLLYPHYPDILANFASFLCIALGMF